MKFGQIGTSHQEADIGPLLPIFGIRTELWTGDALTSCPCPAFQLFPQLGSDVGPFGFENDDALPSELSFDQMQLDRGCTASRHFMLDENLFVLAPEVDCTMSEMMQETFDEV